jgi:hypothetical protein
MKAEAYPLKTIFGKDIRYVVPLYQRPYVWDREGKWEPLWEDVRLLTSELLESSHTAQQDGPLSPHFLGAIVLDQRFGPTGDLEVRYIIDGQQRLTTLQLLLAAASWAAGELGLEQSARLLRKLTANDPDLFEDSDHQFKVWPTNTDRDAFRSAMVHGAPTGASGLRISECYAFFCDAVVDWAESLGGAVADGFEMLVKATRDYLKLVVIDLENEDNAQVIFETLNARTTQLLAIDLVKNLVFRYAERRGASGADLEALYVGSWRRFDTEDWRREIRQGRLNRPRAEIFLMHWLTMKRCEETPANWLYPAFRRVLDKDSRTPVAEVIDDFAHDARTFERFERQPAGSREATFFRRLSVLDVSTIYPLLLQLFRRQSAALTPARRRRTLELLESWLIRRMLCRVTAKNYNRYFLELLRAVEADIARADEIVRDELSKATAETNRWPEDAELSEILISRSLYQSIPGTRIVMVLAAVEGTLRTSKSEMLELPQGLTIEHVLPQAWKENWPVNLGDQAAEYERSIRVNRLGNLTLLTASLNPALSNAAWGVKRAELRRHSLLLLNRELCEEHPSVWDEAGIDDRSAVLAGRIAQVWPGPHASCWDDPPE